MNLDEGGAIKVPAEYVASVESNKSTEVSMLISDQEFREIDETEDELHDVEQKLRDLSSRKFQLESRLVDFAVRHQWINCLTLKKGAFHRELNWMRKS